MSEIIEQAEAREFIDYYNEACIAKGEDQADVTRCFVLERTSLEEIFAAAELAQIECPQIRIYFGKNSTYDPQLNHPKFSAKDDYNLVVVGVDPDGENINITQQIFDHLNGASGLSGTPSGNDF